ncbi:hypothetical protein EYV94_24360 [Puteibacter caeruleilacunae]|nr:hypothetical protein EYV94_24360 [Puteibacter caeruleilacunae]
MKNVLVCVCFLLICVANGYGQEKNSRISFFNGNKLALSVMTESKFYPELQIEETDLELKDGRFTFALKNEIEVKDYFLEWGLGFSYSDEEDNYAVLPVNLRIPDLLSKKISLSIGAELGSDFGEMVKLTPLIGVSVDF